MKQSFLFVFLVFNLGINLFAQSNDVLFTIDGIDVPVAEFERVYTKNNINNQADYSEKSLQEYLDLYVNFRLKVREAEVLQMDTIKRIKNELATYKKQLIQSYINDKNVSEDLLKEAYERSKYEVDVSHIMIAWPNEYPSSGDSTKVKKEIQQILKQANSSNFAELAVKYSQDPSAKNNKGHLGYITVFQTVYPFENKLYETKIGDISEPFPTQFGYHIILVHDKIEARGTIKPAHLLILSKDTDSPEKQSAAKQQIVDIYNELMAEQITFNEAVLKYSNDNKTKYNGGQLAEMSSRAMLPEFAEAAFAIEQDGGLSEPIQTKIGWHIIQRVYKKEPGSFEDVKTQLDVKVKQDSRSNVTQEKSIKDTKEHFGYQLNQKALNTVCQEFTFDNSNTNSFNESLFTIGDQEYKQNDFTNYLTKNVKVKANSKTSPAQLRSWYFKFENEKIMQYRADHLAEINVDYKNLLQEYHDGILLFELTDEKVWGKAVVDTAGLKAFYNVNKNNYQWKERLNYYKVSFENETDAMYFDKLLAKKSWDKALMKIEKKEIVYVVTEEKKEKENIEIVNLPWKENARLIDEEDNNYVVYFVKDVLPPTVKVLEETRGYVISDYQNQLEKEWIQELKGKYVVNINDAVFKSLIRK